MTLSEFIENRLQALGKTWSDLIDEGDISNIAAQQMQQGTWRRHSGTLQKLTRYLKCTAGEIQECMRVRSDNELSKEAERPEGQTPKCKEGNSEKVKDKPAPVKKSEKQQPECEEINPDTVNHPAHYQLRGFPKGFETIDVNAAVTADLMGMEAVCTANALKYLIRWKHKNGVEDLKKARWYLERLIMERENG